MNRIAVLALLTGLSASWPVTAKAQDNGVAKYLRDSPKASKKAAKQQRKAWKKFAKAQRKAVKQGNRQARSRNGAYSRSPL
jgi:hypothetical protein